MKGSLKLTIYKLLLSLLLGFAVFIACVGPLRPLLNWYEQQHLFRWCGAYINEQIATPGGVWELIVSFFTQFFVIGWLGALMMAILAVILQIMVWRVMKICHLAKAWLYPFSLIPSLLLFYFVFIPSSYRQDKQLRETITYDYLVRSRQWQAILRHSKNHPPIDIHSLWCTNYALAKCGILNDSLFHYPQTSPDGLLLDGRHVDYLPLFALSDIFFDIGFINDAERIAFDAKQLLPEGHKSGRLYQRLLQCNIENGDTAIAAKYQRILKSTIFYQHTFHIKSVPPRVMSDSSISSVIPYKLQALIHDHPSNKLAQDYLLAYQLLRLDFESVLNTEQQIQTRHPRVAPLAVQECIIGNWVMTHPNDSFPIGLRQDVFDQTMRFFQMANQTGNMLDPTLSRLPYSQSYWHYHALSQQQIHQQP